MSDHLKRLLKSRRRPRIMRVSPAEELAAPPRRRLLSNRSLRGVGPLLLTERQAAEAIISTFVHHWFKGARKDVSIDL